MPLLRSLSILLRQRLLSLSSPILNSPHSNKMCAQPVLMILVMSLLNLQRQVGVGTLLGDYRGLDFAIGSSGLLWLYGKFEHCWTKEFDQEEGLYSIHED